MKVGLLVPNLGPLATGPGSVDVVTTIATKAEELGYDALWVGPCDADQYQVSVSV